ncbi:MAG: hypothetical protein KDD35_03930 [Bdellovibrionales bacterium]|nr:hypothetical protein [Bdellovibrionales bacterium]
MICQLKKTLGSHLIPFDQVRTKEGIPTGWTELDQFLSWRGLPRGGLTLIVSPLGRGSTTLWSQTIIPLTQQQKWVVWVNSKNVELCPWSLYQKGVDFSRLLVVSSPANGKELLWVLQELLSLSLFEIIGCDLGDTLLHERDLLKLNRQARQFKTSLTFITTREFISSRSVYDLILKFDATHLKVARARHRPTPHFILRKPSYADIMPQLTKGSRILLCRKFSPT